MDISYVHYEDTKPDFIEISRLRITAIPSEVTCPACLDYLRVRDELEKARNL